MLVTVALRYGGIAFQFVILMILARHLSLDDYGRYMLVLSAVLPTYPLLGLGASETFVREAPRLLQRGHSDEVAALVGATLTAALGMAACVALVGGVLIWLLPLSAATTTLAAFAVAFFIANGLMFNVAQLLLGGGLQALGSFFFYPAVNLSLLTSSVPYVLFMETPTFRGVAVATSSAALLMAAGAILLVAYLLRPAWASVATIRHLVRIGIRLSSARALGHAGNWLPTLLAGVVLEPVQAGYIGTASRVTAAVGAVNAAVRFAVRPSIVRAFEQQDHVAIKQTCGRLATATVGIAWLALAVSAIAGHTLIAFTFSPDLASAAPLLTILLVGVACEAFGGPVDEVLKMTGHEKSALAILAAGVASAALAIFVVAPLGVTAMAWVQVGYSMAVFGTMILAVRRKLGIWLHPILPRVALTSLSATRERSEGSLDS
jgi:O-antigen/teichoic acid export membrane protein